jgi:Acyclic terpene utilisation family protein AtuA
MLRNSNKIIRIGAGAGYSGDRISPAVELAELGALDYLVFECLAERTIALAQLERTKNPADPALGFDPLLRDRMLAVLPSCVANGTKIISNMGAANPRGAAVEVLAVAKELGIAKLRVAVVEGDDVIEEISAQSQLTIMETGKPLGSLGGNIISANAYLGAEGVVQALATGADVVITGRVADPALFLAPMMFEFGWSPTDWPLIGQGIVVGHLLECAGQITGGYYADPGYRDVPELARLGFPIAEVSSTGQAVICKVESAGGCVTVGTCTAQLLYEIEDPSSYLQPDVVADFSQVALSEIDANRIRVSGGQGKAQPATLKVTVGYRDGFIGEGQISYAGPGAYARGKLALEVLRYRFKQAGMQDYESRYELIGVDAMLGESYSTGAQPQEVRVRAAFRVPTKKLAEQVANEVETLYTNGPASGGGVTKSVREVIAVASVLLARERVKVSVTTVEY